MIAAGRVCARCGLWKPATEFYKGISHSSGLYSYCRPCNAARQKEKYNQDLKASRRKKLAERKLYIQRHPERVRENTKRQNLRKAARRVGISVADIAAMLEAQDHRCAICGRRDTKRRLHLDHDHATGRFRALLCASCNLGLGKFGDDPELLRRAAAYLEV